MTEAVQPFTQDTPAPVDMPAPIYPTVGRVVHYWPHAGDMGHNADQPLAAIVTYVWTDRMVNMVNLCVFDVNGVPHSKTSVMLVQPGQLAPQADYCEWMPYQKGQAAKTEALEQQIAASSEAQPDYGSAPSRPDGNSHRSEPHGYEEESARQEGRRQEEVLSR